eukprot:scaffold4429_cov81-Skeletonema_dohrnii-CCMP3373.AAC.5
MTRGLLEGGPPLNQPFKKWRVEEKEAPRAEKNNPPITGDEAKVYATLKSDTIMHTHEDGILDIKIVGEKAHRHHITPTKPLPAPPDATRNRLSARTTSRPRCTAGWT